MRRAEYQRSQACCEQYRTVNGMRPEAFARLRAELPDPSAECGRTPEAGSERQAHVVLGQRRGRRLEFTR